MVEAAVPDRAGERSSGQSARRSLWVAGLVSLGVVLGAYAGDPGSGVGLEPWAATGAALAIAMAGWALRGARAVRIAAAAALVCFAAGWTIHRLHRWPAGHLGLVLAERSALWTVEGTVLEDPVLRHDRPGRLGRFFPPTPRTSMLIRIESARAGIGAPEDLVSKVGRVRVLIDGPVEGVSAGARVRVKGMARSVWPPMNPGEFDLRPVYRARGIAGVISVDTADGVELLPEAEGWSAGATTAALRFIASLRSRAGAWLEGSPEDALNAEQNQSRALLRALLLGADEQELSELRDAFQRLGLSHILSISGLNLVLLAGTVLLVLRLLGDRPVAQAVIASACVLAYLLIIPARAPVVRAALMVWALLLTESTGRRYDRVSVLGWVFVALVLWRPRELASAGFQLSFAVVAGLLLLCEPLRVKMFGPRPERDTYGPVRAALESIKDAAAGSLVAWGVSAPLVAYHVGIVSPYGAIATLLLMPLVALLMGAGYLVLIAGVLLPWSATMIEPAIRSVAGALGTVVKLMDGIPGSVVYLPALHWSWAVVALVAVMLWMRAPGIKGWSRSYVLMRWAATLATALWFGAAMAWTGLRNEVAARLDTLAVGDGACHLLRVRDPQSGRTEAMLWDCGSLALRIGERTIPAALRTLGAGPVRTVVLSHPNVDHYSGLLDVLGPLGVRRVIVGEGFERQARADPTGPVAHTLDRLREGGVEIRVLAAGDQLEIGGSRLEFLSPARGASWKNANDMSLVARVNAGATVLFTGDIERGALAELMSSDADLRADVLELPHHGSAHEVAYDFVARVDPSVVVQSTGPGRVGDRRWDDSKSGRSWFVTAERGAVSTTILRGGDIVCRTWRRE